MRRESVNPRREFRTEADDEIKRLIIINLTKTRIMIVKSVRVLFLLKKHLEKRLGSDCGNGRSRFPYGAALID
ncbi:MAG: hypothetical protein M3R14_03260 [Acidobacteriota bacterium]|nr:hypothetical protein [Acidobacteriota bacterium]